jgi:hypothetical protein
MKCRAEQREVIFRLSGLGRIWALHWYKSRVWHFIFVLKVRVLHNPLSSATYLTQQRSLPMIQLVILALSVVMIVGSIGSFSGKMKLTNDKTLSGGLSILAGIGLLIGAAVAAYFAIIILPSM